VDDQIAGSHQAARISIGEADLRQHRYQQLMRLAAAASPPEPGA
jgi:hypothetical protein